MGLPDAVAALPCWRGTLTGERLSGGLSNEIWKVTDDAGAHVVRLGRDYPFHHVDRAREVMTARAAHAAGFGPEVRYAAPGVMVTAFIGARTWGAEDLRANPERVGRLLAEFHRRMAAGISGPAFLFWPFHVVRDYARTLRGTATRGRHGPLPRPVGRDGAGAGAASHRLRAPRPPARELPRRRRRGSGSSTTNTRASARRSSTSPGRRPTPRCRRDAARALLAAYFGAAPDPALSRAFDAMQVASLLRETLWAYVSDLHLAAPGVDYLAYAAENRARLDAALDRLPKPMGNRMNLPDRAQIVVIGGGIIGCSTAYHLARDHKADVAAAGAGAAHLGARPGMRRVSWGSCARRPRSRRC